MQRSPSFSFSPRALILDRFPLVSRSNPQSKLLQELTDLASKSKKGLAEVALGQGQADTALDRLRDAMASGSWVVLKNLHLMTSWVPVLAKEVAGGSPHPDFRL